MRYAVDTNIYTHSTNVRPWLPFIQASQHANMCSRRYVCMCAHACLLLSLLLEENLNTVRTTKGNKSTPVNPRAHVI